MPDRLGVARLGVVELGLGEHADAPAAPEVGREADPGAHGGDGDLVLAGHLDVVDVVEHEDEQEGRPRRVGDGLAGRPLADVAAVGVEVVLDHLGGQGGAVVEGDALAHGEGPLGEVVVGLDAGEEVGVVATVLVGHDQRVVHRPGDGDAGDGQLGLGQAPPVGGLGLQPVRQRAAADGVVGRRALAVGLATARGGQQGESQQRCGDPHEPSSVVRHGALRPCVQGEGGALCSADDHSAGHGRS